MKRKELSQEELNRRIAEIDAREPEELTEEEVTSLAAAKAMDDGSVMTLDEFRDSLDEYSGKLVLRIPRSLHKELKEAAAIEGISLNQYMLYKLSKA